MILPIVAYGDPVLRKVSKEIDQEYRDLKQLIEHMWETMYGSHGVGLAAPQIGKAIRLFVIDAAPFAEDEDLSQEEQNQLKAAKMVFINAKIIEESGVEWSFNEGCLSIPDVREEVMRKSTITVEYQDENFVKKTEVFDGVLARVIQHEYDHIEGILFTDKLSPLKKRMLKGKLSNISKGKIQVDYKMRFPELKKRR
jgi:peptide deformylase